MGFAFQGYRMRASAHISFDFFVRGFPWACRQGWLITSQELSESEITERFLEAMRLALALASAYLALSAIMPREFNMDLANLMMLSGTTCEIVPTGGHEKN